MKNVILDGRQIHNREELFESIWGQLQSEVFVGNNLDAFYDALTENSQNIELIFEERELLQQTLGDYFQRFLKVYREYRQERGL